MQAVFGAKPIFIHRKFLLTMNSKQIGKTLAVVLFAISLASLTSCHRGYGCPTDLKVGSTVDVAPVQVAKSF